MKPYGWRPRSPTTNTHRYNAAYAGEIPGEVLSLKDSDRLVAELHDLGWSDVEIATHTRWSTYTVARKRGRIGLQPNQPKGAAA